MKLSSGHVCLCGFMISQAIKCLALEVSKAAMIGLAVSMFHFMTSKSRAGKFKQAISFLYCFAENDLWATH